MKLLIRISLVLILLFAFAVATNYLTLPTSNTPATHFDAIIVLGNPANPDGSPAPEMRERVLEGIREYRCGIAPRLIMTGAAAHNQYTEARIMADFARGQGVPAGNLILEPRALNTIQNIFYSAEIMRARGWRSAEVVSSPSHLPRASLILTTFDRTHPELALSWRTNAAPWPPEYSLPHKLLLYSAEAMYCLKLRLLGFPDSPFLPHPKLISLR